MSFDALREALERRAPGQWELYEKRAESHEIETAGDLTRTSRRREEGWAARWWEDGGPRFAAATSPGALVSALHEAARLPASEEPPPEWPAGKRSLADTVEDGPAPADLFEDLSRAVSAASRGEASLYALSVRRGRARERIVNGAGLDVAQEVAVHDGVASALGRRSARSCLTRLPFRLGAASEIETLARRLADAATLPLSDRPAPIPHGQWLLDPAVGAALLSAIAPLFVRENPPRWVARGQLGGPALAIADDATADAPFDGEGSPTRRVSLVLDGAVNGRLDDLRSARRAGVRSSGHGVRTSYRTPPEAGPRRLFFEAREPSSSAALLSSVRRGLFAAALTSPFAVDLDADRYEAEFTGVSILAGRAEGPVAAARASGRLSELLRRIAGFGSDLQFFPTPFLTGSPTVLVERASFE